MNGFEKALEDVVLWPVYAMFIAGWLAGAGAVYVIGERIVTCELKPWLRSRRDRPAS